MAALMRAVLERLAAPAPGGTATRLPRWRTAGARARLARLRWRVRREFSRLGWPGLAGLALLAAAAVLWLGAWSPDEGRARQLRAEVAGLRTRLHSAGASGSAAAAALPSNRATQLATFHEFFPAVSTLPDWLAALHAAAARNRLALESGDYTLVPPRGEQRLWRYEISLPMKGTWPQLRGFVSEALEQIPAAGLENVVLRREAVGAAQVEAKLEFVLWLGAGRRGGHPGEADDAGGPRPGQARSPGSAAEAGARP